MKISNDLEREILRVFDENYTQGHNIEPVAIPHDSQAYAYKKFSEELDVADLDVEALLLDLHERGFLKKHIWDRLFTCSTCNSWHLNLREVCPACKSLEWQKKTLYHHFSCGYVGLESEFKSSAFDELHCPKCEQVLRHIGLDYEKPTQSFYCHSCEHIFDEHKNEGFCLDCKNITDLDDLKIREIYSFSLSPKAYQALEKGSLKESSFKDLVIDKESGLHSYDYFIYQLENQRFIAQEFDESISILIGESPIMAAFCNYARKKLNASFFVSKCQNKGFIAATRKNKRDQYTSLKEVVNSFVEQADQAIMFSLFCVELDTDIEAQLKSYKDSNEKSFEERPEGGLCEF